MTTTITKKPSDEQIHQVRNINEQFQIAKEIIATWPEWKQQLLSEIVKKSL